MSIPKLNYPQGLQSLTNIDEFRVTQQVELFEAFTGGVTNNKYSIANKSGEKIFLAIEQNDCCSRNCFGSARPFELNIMDPCENNVIHLHRPLECDNCCCPCCLQKMEVSAPPGHIVGTIEQQWSICFPKFRCKNAAGDVVLYIEGPFCTTSCGNYINFKILSISGNQVGKITKTWSGLALEMLTDADFFSITFPMDLDVHMKATMLGACFLIDAMFFESG